MGIFKQNGQKDFYYKFALNTHQKAFDATEAMKFSLEHQNPLVTGLVEGNNSQSSINTLSLLSINDPNVLLWSVKPSEEGIENGLITRFWNFNSKSVSPIIKLAQPIKSAWQTSHIETNEQKLMPVNGIIKTKFKQHQLQTFRLILK